MESEAELWKRSHAQWLALPRLTWTACPNKRRLVFIILPGDERPPDPFTARWWGSVYLEVEREAKGRWDWRVWPRLFRSTGICCASGSAPRCRDAQAEAARAGLERLEDLMNEARKALEACAAPADAA